LPGDFADGLVVSGKYVYIKKEVIRIDYKSRPGLVGKGKGKMLNLGRNVKLGKKKSSNKRQIKIENF
jgi:hypothetical protein